MSIVGVLILFSLLPLVSSTHELGEDEAAVHLHLTTENDGVVPQAFLVSETQGFEIHPTESENGNMTFFVPNPQGNYSIVAFAEGHFREEMPVILTAGGIVTADIQLDSFETYAVVELNVYSSSPMGVLPVSKANVGILWQNETNSQPVESRGWTDAFGRINFTIPGSGEVAVQVRHDFFEPAHGRHNIDGATNLTYSVHIKNGYVWYYGEVVSILSGQPVDGARVSLHLPIGLGNSVQWIETKSISRSTSSGAFAVAAPQSDVLLKISTNGYFSESLYLGRLDTKEVEVVITPMPQMEANVMGTILDSDTRRPMADVRVGYVAWYGSHAIQNYTETDEQGRFSIISPTGSVKFIVSCPNPCLGEGFRSKVMRLNVAQDALFLGDVLLDRDPIGARELRIRVEDVDGRPVVGAQAWIYDAQREREVANATADGGGILRLPKSTSTDLSLIVQGPGTSSGLAGLAQPSAYKSIAVPYHELSGEPLVLKPSVFVSGKLNMSIKENGFDLSIEYVLPANGDVLSAVLVDHVLGDGNGDIDSIEINRFIKNNQDLLPINLEQVLILQNGLPLTLQRDSIGIIAVKDNDNLVYSQRGHFNWQLGETPNSFEFKVPNPPYSNLSVEIEIGESVEAKIIEGGNDKIVKSHSILPNPELNTTSYSEVYLRLSARQPTAKMETPGAAAAMTILVLIAVVRIRRTWR